ncbi:MAG: hypothetical protein KTR33_12925 [Gammaproteobacteria bacterium]|nr:hypothetical protein [Gammaproteobacteria bacterium]
MLSKLNKLLIASLLVSTSLSGQAAGFRAVEVIDPGFKPLKVGLWYPSDQAPPTAPNTEFGLPMATDAPVGQSNGGLILISHGYSGWYGGHADTAAALADAGFIVAAPSHTGNTWSDMSSSIDQWSLDRPRHISRVIDFVLADATVGSLVDAGKIGMYGFSAGGFTALGLIGGVPDFNYAAQYCIDQPNEFVCSEGMLEAMLGAGMAELPESAWGADSRVKAAAIAAPGFGFAYTRDSLAAVEADVQLWSGELDESVPTESNAAVLAERLPASPETHWIENASHFAFMLVACRDAFKEADPEEYQLVCGDVEGFDRRAFHADMHREMVRFFSSSLGLKR